MQTKLRTTLLIFAASLLSVSIISDVSHAKARAAKKESHFVGIASWYGLQHQGRKMANGKRFDLRKMTAASWYVPLGTVIRVVNLENGRAVTVTVTDRGPNFRLHRVLDLSEAAAGRLGYVEKGLTQVLITPMPSYQPQHAQLRRTLIELSQPQFVAAETTPVLAPGLLPSRP